MQTRMSLEVLVACEAAMADIALEGLEGWWLVRETGKYRNGHVVKMMPCEVSM
jgi:hypothetical protein